MGDETEPIEDDELLYRRIDLPEYYDPQEGPDLSPHAFHPRQHDRTGISFYRARYFTPEQVARRGRRNRYYIAVLRAGDIRASGLAIAPRTEGHQLGHVELPGLKHENRRSNAGQEAEQLLARKLCLKILGPFDSI